MKEKKGEIKSLFGLREWFTKKLAQKVRSSIKEGGRGGRDKTGNGAKSTDGKSI